MEGQAPDVKATERDAIVRFGDFIPWKPNETAQETQQRKMVNGQTAETILAHPMIKAFFDGEEEKVRRLLALDNQGLPCPAPHRIYIFLHAWIRTLNGLKLTLQKMGQDKDDLIQAIIQDQQVDPADALTPEVIMAQFRDPDFLAPGQEILDDEA